MEHSRKFDNPAETDNLTLNTSEQKNKYGWYCTIVEHKLREKIF